MSGRKPGLLFLGGFAQEKINCIMNYLRKSTFNTPVNLGWGILLWGI
jgi:hypothetical protein